jgi:hypothetical protein
MLRVIVRAWVLVWLIGKDVKKFKVYFVSLQFFNMLAIAAATFFPFPKCQVL